MSSPPATRAADVAELDDAPGDVTAPVARSRVGRWSDRVAHLRPHRLALRTRILLMFTLGALSLSAFLAAAAYGFARSNLVNQRDRASVEQAYRSAQVAQDQLRATTTDAQDVLRLLQSLGVARPALNVRGRWTAVNSRFGSDAIPAALQSRVLDEGVPSRMIVDIDDDPYLITGIPLTVGSSSYFEFASLGDVDSALRSVGISLLFGAAITTLLGGVVGAFAARRAVRPLGDAARAAKAIAGGDLDTRLGASDDPDLEVLASAFNDMAAALQDRVERDARFTSDVSHELRSPLMTLSASVEVMQARREDMPERAQAALDLLVGDVSRFQGLVEDLLEISRFDAGAIQLHLEDLLVAEFVRQAVAVSSLPRTPVRVTERAELMLMQGDRRRLARVLANLIDNARLHGGGDPSVVVSEAHDDGETVSRVWIAVEDHGSGVPPEERGRIFARFARGGTAGRRSANDGAGLGLALVDEHVKVHGGRVWVEDRADGEPGARFVLELPAEEMTS